MNIKNKLLLALGTLTMLVLVLGMFAVNSLFKLEDQNEIFSSLSQANTKMYQARLSQADYMLLGENRFITAVREHTSSSIKLLNNAAGLMEIQASIDEVDGIKQQVDEFVRAFQSLVDAYTSDDSALKQNATDRLMSSANRVSELTEALLAVESQVANGCARASQYGNIHCHCFCCVTECGPYLLVVTKYYSTTQKVASTC